MKKKVLYVARLFSGLETSLSSRYWDPTGVPTIYKVIDAIDKEFDSKFIFTAKDYEEEFFPTVSETFYINGLSSPITVLSGNNTFPIWVGKYRKYLREIYQSLYIVIIAIKFKPDVIYIGNANIWTGAILSRFCKKSKVVFRVMGLYQSMRDALVSNSIWYRIIRKSYKTAFSAAIITQDGTGVEPWINSALNKKTQTYTLLNGIPDLKIDISVTYDKLLNLPKNKVIVLFLGRLEPEKGCFEFLDQFLKAELNLHGKIHALIVGSGKSEVDMKNLAKKNNATDKITFIKRLSHSQVIEAHKCSDIYVSLNKRGNLSNANLEAMAMGQCMIIPESQPNLSIDIVTDRLIPDSAIYRVSWNDDIKELEDAIIFLSNNTKVRKKMGVEIKKIANKLLGSWDKRVDKEIEIIKSLSDTGFS